MTMPLRLPVAPRPFRNELLSSWMIRVSACYGLEPSGVTTWLAGQGSGVQSSGKIDDVSLDPDLLKLWAMACRVDPGRLGRMALKSRFPEYLPQGFLERSRMPVCLGCFDVDFTAGRDSYFRSRWKLADQIVCPTHSEMLCDRCPDCSSELKIEFRMWGEGLRPFCCKCGELLTNNRRATGHAADVDFVAGVLHFQRKMQSIVRGDPNRRQCLEHIVRALWAPLDRVDAARPVLALWFDKPGWKCPFEARAAVGQKAPLRHLPVSWRALTLAILGDLFGTDLVLGAEMPEVVDTILCRAAPIFIRSSGGWARFGREKNVLDYASGRVHRLSRSPVHPLNGNLLDERADLGPIHP